MADSCSIDPVGRYPSSTSRDLRVCHASCTLRGLYSWGRVRRTHDRSVRPAAGELGAWRSRVEAGAGGCCGAQRARPEGGTRGAASVRARARRRTAGRRGASPRTASRPATHALTTRHARGHPNRTGAGKAPREAGADPPAARERGAHDQADDPGRAGEAPALPAPAQAPAAVIGLRRVHGRSDRGVPPVLPARDRRRVLGLPRHGLGSKADLQGTVSADRSCDPAITGCRRSLRRTRSRAPDRCGCT
jgi:hypothetical protein